MTSHSAPSRGDATREALVQAGIRIFARDGFHAATSRGLAAAAGVNQALIGYHFGGKEGLYLAVFEHVAGQVASRMVPVAAEVLEALEDIEARPEHRAERCVVCMMALLSALGRVLTQPGSADWAKLIVREQQDPSPAFDLLYNGVLGRVSGVLFRLVGLATGLNPAAPEVRVEGITLIGQVLVLRVANAAVVRLMDWRHGIGDAEFALWETEVRRNLEARFLGGPAS